MSKRLIEVKHIASGHSDLILCIIKGFKPKGDDNRPDRGILPFAAMLSSTDTEVMTYIYGPVTAHNLDTLIQEPLRLANSNGLWKSVLALSNYVALDVPVLSTYFPVLVGHCTDKEILLETSELKEYYTKQTPVDSRLIHNEFIGIPQSFHEDDVDTGIHFLFSHLLSEVCFEGMCNPPGGDWSGLSVLYGSYEFRWLSLPRISEVANGKRPDHVLELFRVFTRPVLLSIESKERSSDLESNVGHGLVNYIRSLMGYIPNVKRPVRPTGSWMKAKEFVNYNEFEFISAAAYLKEYAQANEFVFDKSNCDMLFIMEPFQHGWIIEIITNTFPAKTLKAFICNKIKESSIKYIIVF
ncbi:MAG: hypothetical protein HFH67_01435 [Lachnospiraceae bacterium]|nr:hypothetical protein [Lachnospiraceae bacterium]